MTPKEKAKELVYRFKRFASKGNTDSMMICRANAKRIAIICVDEILSTDDADVFTNWWEEVKQEIEKL